jgi:hypothetical protein
MMEISLDIKNKNMVSEMLRKAPKRILIGISKWLYGERNRYVGNQRRDGKFRQQFRRLKAGAGAWSSFSRPGTWSKNIVKSFKGYVLDKDNPYKIRLRMGFGLRNPSEFVQGLRMMEESATNRSIASSKFMTIPAYRNLNKYGLGIHRKAENAFTKAREQGIKLIPIRGGYGSLLWFDASQKRKRATSSGASGGFKRSALLFVGRKGIKLSPKFNFKKQFYGQKAAMILRGQKKLNREIRDFELGYVGQAPIYSHK